MAATHPFKVYVRGEYIASCKDPETCAMIIGCHGEGEILLRHRHVLWREGKEDVSAAESYDRVAEIVATRLEALVREAQKRK